MELLRPRVYERSLWDWAFVIILMAAVIYQVFVPPAVGLPDNGDFSRLTQTVGLVTVDTCRSDDCTAYTRYYKDGFFCRIYWPSSELLFVWPALAINPLYSKTGYFDILTMGLMHTLAYLALGGLVALCGYRTRHPLRWIVYLVILLLFTDVAYVAYFNTLFAEPASMMFLMASLASAWFALTASREGRSILRPVNWFVVFSILFVFAKFQNATLGPVMAACAYFLCSLESSADKVYRTQRLKLRKLGVAAILGGSLVCWMLSSVHSLAVGSVNVYDSVFYEILRTSNTKPADLKSLGLDQSYLKYAGTHVWSPGVTTKLRVQVYQQVGERGVLRFYLTHPGRFFTMLWCNSAHAFETRPGYMGNWDKWTSLRMASLGKKEPLKYNESAAAGSATFLRLPKSYFSHAFETASSLKRSLLVGKSWPLLVFVLLNIAAIALKLKYFDKRDESRVLTAIHAALLGMAILQFVTSTVGAGCLDLVKHLFLFTVLCDLCFVFLVAYAVSLFGNVRDSGGLRALVNSRRVVVGNRETAEPSLRS